MEKIMFNQGNGEDLVLIKSLWTKLNRLHYERTQNFKDRYASMTFEARMQAIISKSTDIHLEYAIESGHHEIIGYCISSIENDGTTGEIDSIFIEEPYRRSGIGKTLFERSLQWLQDNHTDIQRLSVAVGNEEVLTFYRQFEFYPLHLILQKKERR